MAIGASTITVCHLSNIAHWLGRLLYWNLPWWVFVAAYAAFALLVSLTWRWVPPVRR